MKDRKFSRSLSAVAALLLVGSLISPFLEKANLIKTSSAAAAANNNYIYLPLVMQKFPIQTVFGAAMDNIDTGGGLEQMAAANTSWTRPMGVSWSSVEPTQGHYDWSVLAGLESELKNASSRNLQVVLLVHSTPEWARKYAGTGPSCGPMAADKISAFGDFMHEMVVRYSVAPYNVKYWELWNEEDIAYSSGDSGIGCWGGDTSDPTYFGGGYYADMLKVVYPKIKSVNSQAQVLIGGLLMDCDPRGGCGSVGHDSLPGTFLEGILHNGGGPYFDGVSYHAYDYYLGNLGQYYNPNWLSAWNTTGPVVIAKAQYIQSLLSSYSVTGKFLMNTESALICGTTGGEALCLTDDFAKTKSYYVTQAYVSAIVQGLRANIWYSARGWRASGLLDSSLNPLPAYSAFQFGNNELHNASFVREITGYANVKGYELDRGDRHIWVVWSLDGNSHMTTWPGVPVVARDGQGNAVTPEVSMNVTLNPLYLEWNP